MWNELINSATKEYPFLIKHISVKYIPHFHQETEIVYVMAGELTVTLGVNSYRVREGGICIIPSRMIHNLYTEDYSECFVMKLYSAVDLSNIHLEQYIFRENVCGYEALHGYVEAIIEEHSKKQAHYELAVNILAESIFLFILRKTNYRSVDGKIRLKQISESKIFDSINEYLEAHYCDDFTLDDVAQYLNYTKSYFCRVFKKITGITFWEYYTMYRLEKSIGYIQAFPRDTLTAAAQRSGFKNIRSFYTAFNAYYHCTPNEYRKMLIKQKESPQ